MPVTIAVAGKGGTGKTTFAALVVRYLVNSQKGSVLAVDADPNSNLNEALGVKVTASIADILDDVKNPKAVPAGMTKDKFIEYKLFQALVEAEHFDLLVMGGPQGPGCYCYPNDLLRKQVEVLGNNYDFLIADNEAGLEHISRRTISAVNHLFIISDSSVRGVRSAGRVYQLVLNMEIKVEKIYLVITKTVADSIEKLADEIKATGLELIGAVPLDPLVIEFDISNKALFYLPAESSAVGAIEEILKKCGL